MRYTNRMIVSLALLAWLAGRLPSAGTAQGTSWQARVDPWVQQATASGGEAEFLVFLTEQADLSQAVHLKTGLEKRTFVYQALSRLAARSQGPLLQILKNLGVSYRPYWIANMIWVRGDARLMQILAQRPEVANLYANPSVYTPEPELPFYESAPQAADAIQWNLLKVKADQVWATGYTGQGAVVGGQDTGYDWDHPALKAQYRGWNGTTANHDYNWHDAIHTNDPHTPLGNPCGFNSLVPCDDNNHGTHTMGILVGDDGAGNRIGMAPGARWIGCRNMEQGWGTPASYAECYQWFLAPTDLNGQNPDPAKAPDVINNSWSCPASEGCTDPNVLLSVVNNVRAAGILTVHAAGNSGPGCETVNTPAAIYDASFTVGNTTFEDALALSSSRGPVTADGSGRLKPDIVAPGTDIYSSISGGGYSRMSGTSMAGPHVAGLAALLISARPDLAGNPGELEWLIESMAVRIDSGQTCGGIPATQFPNPTVGWGRIDAYTAYRSALMDFHLVVSAGRIESSGVLTYTFTTTNMFPTLALQALVLTDTLPTNTTFLTATLPYTRSGDLVTWSLPLLEPGASWDVNLGVQTVPGFSGWLVNDRYALRSAEVPEHGGLPVQTLVGKAYFLPLVLRGLIP